MATAWYADDSFLISRWACDKCLWSIVQYIYFQQVSYDETSERYSVAPGIVAIKILDYRVVIDSFKMIALTCV